MTDAIGGNASAVLSGYVDRIVELEDEKDVLVSDRKVVMTEIKGAGLPGKELVQEMKDQVGADPKDRLETISTKRWAAALLGTPCYLSQDPVEFDEKLDPTHVEKARNLVGRVKTLEEGLDEARSTIRDVYAEAKSNGFSTKALRVVVALKRKAGASAKWDEETALVDLYRRTVMG